jgi:hypothetical protein
MGVKNSRQLQQAEAAGGFVVGEYLCGGLAEVLFNQFAKDIAEIRGYGEIAILIEFVGLQARPPAIDFATPNGAAQHHHHVAVAVVGSVVSILFNSAAKLRHRHEDDIFHAVTHIADKCGKRISKLLQKSG